MSTIDLLDLVADDEAARLYLEERRWHGSPFCPFCEAIENIAARTGEREGYYRCFDCTGEFTVRTGTIFERSHVPLSKWIHTMLLLVTMRKKLSSTQLSREIGVTQKTAWNMLRKLREAYGNDLASLVDVVVVNEIDTDGLEAENEDLTL